LHSVLNSEIAEIAEMLAGQLFLPIKVENRFFREVVESLGGRFGQYSSIAHISNAQKIEHLVLIKVAWSAGSRPKLTLSL
jgi:hypothetical protein